MPLPLSLEQGGMPRPRSATVGILEDSEQARSWGHRPYGSLPLKFGTVCGPAPALGPFLAGMSAPCAAVQPNRTVKIDD